MSFRVEVFPNFEREAKHLYKKYKSLRSDLASLVSSLEKNPAQGTALGSGFYKVRMAVASKGGGKSAGARIITFVKVSRTVVYLVSIYDKSEKATITESELRFLVRQIPE